MASENALSLEEFKKSLESEQLEILQEAVGILMGAVMEDNSEGEEIDILDRKLLGFGPRMGM